MSGLISPDSGDVICDGENITPKLRRKNKALCAKLQLVLQNSRAALDPRFSVYDCIAEPIRNLKKCSREEERKIVWQHTEQMELTQNILAQRSGELSGGQQQRCVIGRALIKNPAILLCDEPTGALDYQTGKAILKLLQDTCRQKKMTVIVITHNSALTPMADRVIKIKNGKVSKMYLNENPEPIENIEW